MSAACPCGGGEYATCCGPRHDGTVPAETAEALMRSRYSAYVRGDVDYLAKTQTKPSEGTWEATRTWALGVTWTGLRIVDRAEGVVEFEARYLEGGQWVTLRERSLFVRDAAGRWIYDAGKPTVSTEKPARNEPCPCGSGKKFKQCHA